MDRDPAWFEQVWFGGVHSDVGGSYPEPEARLSDVSMEWMLRAAVDVGLEHDPDVLRLFPDALGPQHDEAARWPFRLARRSARRVPKAPPLHPSIVLRMQAPTVRQNGRDLPYRPESLRGHPEVSGFYGTNAGSHEVGSRRMDDGSEREASTP